jgi:RND family efflux transporter MFP subunit
MSLDEELAKDLASLRIPPEKRSDLTRSQRSGNSTLGIGNKFIRGLGLLLASAIIVWIGYRLYSRGASQLLVREYEIATITLISPAHENAILVATGYVYSRHKVTIAPKVAGQLARLLVSEGELVKAGQLVAELDASEAQAQLAQLRADQAVARARLERVRADLSDVELKAQREVKLLGSGAGTLAAAEDAAARVASARAQSVTAQAELEAVQAHFQAATVTLDHTKILAPFAGTIIRQLSEVGEVIAAGTGIFIEVSLADLEVQADVAEVDLSKVKVAAPVEVLLDAFPDRRFRGEVQALRQAIDRTKAAVAVKVRFVDPVAGILPDMAARVSFLPHALDDAAMKVVPKLVVPINAVVQRAGNNVLLAVEGGYVHEVTVVTGATLGNLIELRSGPPTGTRVIRNPPSDLHTGALIKEKDEK